MNCHICNTEGAVLESPHYHNLGRTTSDCKPWKSGGRIGLCSYCGSVQKIIDEQWQIESAEIYSEYQIYHQSPKHAEQPIYIKKLDKWMPRSESVLMNFVATLNSKLKKNGNALDIGCGNGATLKALLKILPNYQRFGYDPTASNMDALKDRADLDITDCSQKLENLPNNFDLMTMIHVLEHIPNPIEKMREYANMLNPEGYFIVVVPDLLKNPFDITIADHCSHFCADTLTNLLKSSGLEIESISVNTIPKEIVAICRKSSSDTKNTLQQRQSITERNQKTLHNQIAWLKAINQDVTKMVSFGARFGIFGTSIAGNWMYGQWRDHIEFFVDEDPDRLGTTYRNVPIVSIDALTTNDTVYVALPPEIASRIKKKYANAECKIYIPPPICPQGDLMLLDNDQVNKIAKPRCAKYRRRIMDISQQIGALHMAPAFSCVEIVDSIYNFLMREDQPHDLRDVFIMSKGHGCMIQYVILEDKGILPSSDLDNFGKDGGRLGVHPDYGVPGIEASTGSLGHGLALAVGMSYADKTKGQDNKTFCVCSDGELQEGSTWESILMASTLGLNNLVLFVDNNNFISIGKMNESFPNFYPLADKFNAFGWESYTVDGHNPGEIYEAAVSRSGTKPCVIVCNTIKGKGVSFMENQAIWHYRSPTPDEYAIAIKELEESAI